MAPTFSMGLIHRKEINMCLVRWRLSWERQEAVQGPLLDCRQSSGEVSNSEAGGNTEAGGDCRECRLAICPHLRNTGARGDKSGPGWHTQWSIRPQICRSPVYRAAGRGLMMGPDAMKMESPGLVLEGSGNAERNRMSLCCPMLPCGIYCPT